MSKKNVSEEQSKRDMLLLVRLLQFSDSTMPVGSFAFSNGLESAIQTGIVNDAHSLREFVQVIVRQAAYMDAVAGLHAHYAFQRADFAAVLQADQALWDCRIGSEQHMMLARMGKKLAELALRIDDFPPLRQWLAAIKNGSTPGCFPVGQALALSHMGASAEQIFIVHQYSVAAMVLSAALRLMRIDHLDTQGILYAVQDGAATEFARISKLGLDEMSNFAPVFDVLVAHHLKAHVRLFMN